MNHCLVQLQWPLWFVPFCLPRRAKQRVDAKKAQTEAATSFKRDSGVDLIVSDAMETFGLPHNENSHSKWHRDAEELQGSKVTLSASESDFSLCRWGLTEWKISSNITKFSCLSSHWFVSCLNMKCLEQYDNCWTMYWLPYSWLYWLIILLQEWLQRFWYFLLIMETGYHWNPLLTDINWKLQLFTPSVSLTQTIVFTLSITSYPRLHLLQNIGARWHFPPLLSDLYIQK